jgi:hypothetical protein
MANLNIGNDSYKEYLSNKNKNQNCFAYDYESNTEKVNKNAMNANSDVKKTNQETYRSYLDAQVTKKFLNFYLIDKRKK